VTFASSGREKIEIDEKYCKPNQEKRYIIRIEGRKRTTRVNRERSKIRIRCITVTTVIGEG